MFGEGEEGVKSGEGGKLGASQGLVEGVDEIKVGLLDCDSWVMEFSLAGFGVR